MAILKGVHNKESLGKERLVQWFSRFLQLSGSLLQKVQLFYFYFSLYLYYLILTNYKPVEFVKGVKFKIINHGKDAVCFLVSLILIKVKAVLCHTLAKGSK